MDIPFNRWNSLNSLNRTLESLDITPAQQRVVLQNAGDLDNIFEKKFKYNQLTVWKLPPTTDLFQEFYTFPNLQSLKHTLNAVKGRLNYFNIDEWSRHTRRSDPTTVIPFKLRYDYRAEFVTIAWCKLYECLHTYDIVKKGKLKSLHLCEAPGAFIAALNHYLHSTFDEVEWNWLATTLNPYYEGNIVTQMITDDRFMLHTMDRWLFYDDFTGNLMCRENILQLISACRQRLGGVDLVTADGSINCMESPGDQEQTVVSLLYSEICAALSILAKGGSFVIKLFTFFESLSVSLLYLLNCAFEEVQIFKPATSKRGNSEVYAICLKYKKSQEIRQLVHQMLNKVESANIYPIFRKEFLPRDFLLQHEVCCRRFMYEQINAIDSNIILFTSRSTYDDRITCALQSTVATMYFKKYQLKPIPLEKRVTPNLEHDFQPSDELEAVMYRGSFSDRQLEMLAESEIKIQLLIRELNAIDRLLPCLNDEDFKLPPEESIPLHVITAKPMDQILSSIYVSRSIFLLRAKFSDLYGIDTFFHCNPLCLLELDKTHESWTVNIKNNISNGIYAHQFEFFKKIIEIILEHKPNRLTFVNVPFLTHYSISVVCYLLANAYHLCQINSKHRIILETETECNEASMRKVHELYQALVTIPQIWSFVDIDCFQRINITKVLRHFNNCLLIRNYKSVLTS